MGYDYIDSLYKLIKGRIAETIIQDIFVCSGYKVYPFGMENTVPTIAYSLGDLRTESSTYVRCMPDYLVQCPEEDNVFFLEVKFRSDGYFTFEDLPRDYPYKNVYFIVVSKRHIKCITYQELKRGEKITPTSKNYLGYRDEFYLDDIIILNVCHELTNLYANLR